MKTLSLLIPLVTIGFGLVGCNDNAEQLVAPDSQAEAISLAKGGPIHYANGNGHVALEFVPGVGFVPVDKSWDILRVFTFNASLYEDGSVKGRVMNIPAPVIPGNHLNGEVTQLVVDGNKAKVMFVDEGVHYGFVVIDNGEGENAQMDRITGLWGEPLPMPPFPTKEEMYSFTPDQVISALGGTTPLYQGNAQVK